MTKFVKTTLTVLTAAVALTVTACGGGGGGSTSTGGTYYSHAQLAQEFVRRVNVDVSGYNLELVKTDTLQSDYIVVYDRDYNSYDAYWLGNYNVGENLSSYLHNYDNEFYYDLNNQGNNSYRDPYTGTLFEKVQASSKNLGKMKALKEELAIAKAADNLRAEYGLSEEKSLDTARFAYKVKTAAPGTYNVKDYDSFAKELTGSTVSEFQNDFKAGNMSSLSSRLSKAGEVSGMGSEGVNKLIKDMFLK